MIAASSSYMMRSAAPNAMLAGVQDRVMQAVADPMSDGDLRDLHADLIYKFEASEDFSKKSRQEAEQCNDYYDGYQIDEKDARIIKKRGQPIVIKNRVRRKIDYLQGLERSKRTEPKALPRTPTHEDDAHAATDALRFIMQDNRYDQIRSRVWKDVLCAGWGGVEVSVEERPGKVPAIKLLRCQWDRMFWDPYSQDDGFADANYLGLVVWMDRVEAIRRYGKEAAKVFDETVSSVATDGYDDRPKTFTWVDKSKRVRIRVVQMYHKDDDGVWNFCEFTKGGFLKYGVSPWLDDDGKPEHPYAWRSAFIDRENNRYGVIRDMIDTQDEINKRAAKALHLVSVRQTFATEGSLGNQTQKEMRQELAKPDGHVQLAHGVEFGKHFGIIPTTDMAQGNFELLQEAKAEFDLQGPNAAMLGKGPGGASGRAILANQQGGAIEQMPLTDGLREIDHEVSCKSWRRARQFWDAETWVRVTDDENNIRWVGLNQPAVDPMTGQPMIDPMTGKPIIPKPVAQLEVDIMIGDAPQVGTMLDEQFASLVELKKYDTNNEIPFRSILEVAPNVRGKQKMLDAMDQRAKQAEQQSDPMQEEAKRVALESEKAKIEKTRGDTANAYASASEKIGRIIIPQPEPRQMPPGSSHMAGNPPPMPPRMTPNQAPQLSGAF